MASVTDVMHLQSREIANSKLAIDSEIEHCEFLDVRSHLTSRSGGPNFSKLQRSCPVSLSLFHSARRSTVTFSDSMTISFRVKGDSVCSFGGALSDPRRKASGTARRSTSAVNADFDASRPQCLQLLRCCRPQKNLITSLCHRWAVLCRTRCDNAGRYNGSP